MTHEIFLLHVTTDKERCRCKQWIEEASFAVRDAMPK